MANVPNGVETLQRSCALVRGLKFSADRQTDDRRTDGRRRRSLMSVIRWKRRHRHVHWTGDSTDDHLMRRLRIKCDSILTVRH